MDEMTGTRDRWKFHKFTLAEVGEIVHSVHIQQADPSPLILGSRLGAGRISNPATVTWFQTYSDNEPWERIRHSGHDYHERYLGWCGGQYSQGGDTYRNSGRSRRGDVYDVLTCFLAN